MSEIRSYFDRFFSSIPRCPDFFLAILFSRAMTRNYTLPPITSNRSQVCTPPGFALRYFEAPLWSRDNIRLSWTFGRIKLCSFETVLLGRMVKFRSGWKTLNNKLAHLPGTEGVLSNLQSFCTQFISYHNESLLGKSVENATMNMFVYADFIRVYEKMTLHKTRSFTQIKLITAVPDHIL